MPCYYNSPERWWSFDHHIRKPEQAVYETILMAGFSREVLERLSPESEIDQTYNSGLQMMPKGVKKVQILQVSVIANCSQHHHLFKIINLWTPFCCLWNCPGTFQVCCLPWWEVCFPFSFHRPAVKPSVALKAPQPSIIALKIMRQKVLITCIKRSLNELWDMSNMTYYWIAWS